MSIKTYRLVMVILTLIVAALVGWSVTTGNVIVPIPTIIAGAIILYLCRRRVKAFTEDERLHSIVNQASRRTVEIVVIFMAIVGAILLAMSRGSSPNLEPAGLTLAYSVCATLIIYNIFYTYYNRKFGGKE
jgi:uncharacterized membrane protein